MMSAAVFDASGDGAADDDDGEGDGSRCCLERFVSEEEEGWLDGSTGDRRVDEYDDLRLPSLGVRTVVVAVVVVAAVVDAALVAAVG
jgi:hypothetical protein